MKNPDLETLKFVKFSMGLFSDYTVFSQGYKWLERKIEEIEQENKTYYSNFYVVIDEEIEKYTYVVEVDKDHNVVDPHILYYISDETHCGRIMFEGERIKLIVISLSDYNSLDKYRLFKRISLKKRK